MIEQAGLSEEISIAVVGDRVILRYSSPTMELRERTLVVDTSGGIRIPSVGRVNLRGQTLGQAEKTLRERLGQAAHQRVRLFSETAMVARTTALYGALLGA